MTDTLLPRGESYADVYARFRWPIPTAYNIAVDVCDRHATDRSRVALVYEDDTGCVSEHTFAGFRARSNQFARALTTLGVARGDRVGIVLPQRPETAVAHLAAYKLGAVALPLSTLFGPDALEYRLRDAGAKVVVTDGESLERVLAVAKGLPALARVISVDRADADGVTEYGEAIAGAPDSLEPVATAAEDPAILIYTSGTTGPPKGALHAHRVLLGHLPAIEFYHEYFPKPGDRHWSPADWAWAGGLLDVLLPSWHYGVTVVAHRPKKFDAERAFDILARHRVRNTFLVPTMLKMMRSVGDPRGRWPLELRSMFTGGEAVGEEVIRWAREALGVTPHEGFGQTEVNLVLGNCSLLMPVKPGSMGRPVPGDVISSGGYRIGPSEIEDCLQGHPAVALAAAIGAPDPVRGEVVKAFVQLHPGGSGTAELARDLQAWVRTRLSAHEYPREIEFIEALPVTTTGKVRRADLRMLERRRRGLET